MGGNPDQIADETKYHLQDIHRTLQRDERIQAEMLARIRLIWRRILGRQNPPASP